MDTWAAVFFAAFLGGLGFTVVSFVLGGHGARGHSGARGHGSHGHGARGHGRHAARGGRNAEGDGLSPFSPLVVATFLGAGGGVAFLLRLADIHPALAASGGAIAGLGVAGALFNLVLRLFVRQGGGRARAAFGLVNERVRVTVAVPAVGTGRIEFVAGGTRQTMAARAANGRELEKGVEAVVVRLADGVAYVASMRQEREPL